MSNAGKLILGIIVIAFIIFVFVVPRTDDNGDVDDMTATTTDETTGTTTDADSDELSQSVTEIVYTDEGFVPSTIEISVGTPVVFVNESTGEMHVASAVHPTHEELPGFDQLAAGDSYVYTFEEVGEWRFHNHEEPSHTGTVTVIE